MDFHIYLLDDISIVVSVRKSTFRNHPVVSSNVYYKNTIIYHHEERKIEGLQYEEFDKKWALMTASETLAWAFGTKHFLYKEFPNRMEYDYRGREIFPHPPSFFPEGSTFEVMQKIINKKANVYLVLNNSIEGLVMTDDWAFLRIPGIEDRFLSELPYNENTIGYLSNRIIGKEFKVLHNGKRYEDYQIVEI